MIVLGLETSCDETAAAVVDDRRRILAHAVYGQRDEHARWGGIVPEVAARAHLEILDRLVVRTLATAGVSLCDLDGIAATGGPGLIGGVIVGVMTGKALALASGRPFLAVNHLEAHALTARLSNGVAFPYLLLLVSGGHCQLLIVRGVGRYQRLGTTVDDALGEAFDKVAKLLGLGYPGGPEVEKAAARGDARRFALPRPMRGRDDCHFSFSGLKTAVRHLVEGWEGAMTDQDIADVAASFQAAAAESVVDRTRRAITLFRQRHPDAATLVVAGGVAANGELRRRLLALAVAEGFQLIAPPPALCTDNAAMVAWAGLERLALGYRDGLDFAPRPRWPLDPDAPAVAFAGVKG